MPGVLVAGLPPGLELDAGCTIEFHAADPVSNADIPGVVLNAVTIWVEGVVAFDSSDFSSGPFMRVPGPGA